MRFGQNVNGQGPVRFRRKRRIDKSGKIQGSTNRESATTARDKLTIGQHKGLEAEAQAHSHERMGRATCKPVTHGSLGVEGPSAV
jgi:hypothetical protein